MYLQDIVFDSMLPLPQDGHGNFSTWPSGALGVSALQAARLRKATSEILYDLIQFGILMASHSADRPAWLVLVASKPAATQASPLKGMRTLWGIRDVVVLHAVHADRRVYRHPEATARARPANAWNRK